ILSSFVEQHWFQSRNVLRLQRSDIFDASKAGEQACVLSKFVLQLGQVGAESGALVSLVERTSQRGTMPFGSERADNLVKHRDSNLGEVDALLAVFLDYLASRREQGI